MITLIYVLVMKTYRQKNAHCFIVPLKYRDNNEMV